MKTLTAKDAKYGFGRLIDLARAEPVTVAKHGRPVVVVMAVEEFERLKTLDLSETAPGGKTGGDELIMLICLGAARRPPPRAWLRTSQRFYAGGQGAAA